MLQRAASNAYSWWWASNIRTKQSKWLDNSLQEMEEKVKAMIKLIEEDADTFAKKAEMYFQRRPVLINFVEEAYREYKALADRYDHLSGELHKANHTLATAFPDQVQLAMEEEDEDGSTKAASLIDASKLVKPSAVLQRISTLNKYKEIRSSTKKPRTILTPPSIDKDKAHEEIDRLQKEILVFQTEREFVKSTYENSLAKYLEIEKQMTDLQDEVSYLQDEFGANVAIEDDEARALMAATALKSCEETLISLQEQQKKSIEESRIESERIREAKKKLKDLKIEYGQPLAENSEPENSEASSTTAEDEICGLKQERLELHLICERVKEHFEMNSDTSVVELAEKIDELVDKIINLELTVSSQNAQITRLRTETNELHKHLQTLEEDKMALIDDSNALEKRLKQAEAELQRIHDLEKSVHNGKGKLRANLTEALNSLNDLSEKLQSPTHHDQAIPAAASSRDEKDDINNSVDEREGIVNSEKLLTMQENEANESKHAQTELPSNNSAEQQQLLDEYTPVLRDYTETREKLSEIEKKRQDSIFEMIALIRDLKSDNAKKEEELHSLRQKLGSPNSNPSENEDPSATKMSKYRKHRSRSLYSIMTEDRYRESKKLDATYFVGNETPGEEIKLSPIEEYTPSGIEEKFRTDIDNLLEENLDFWLRFCTSYHQIQKFKTKLHALKSEVERLKENTKKEGEPGAEQESIPSDKKLREINTELQVWLEQNGLLKVEIKKRSSSLGAIQDEIIKVLKECQAVGVEFAPYQAAKFQGEVTNMQQENNKVANEIQAGIDHVKGLQTEVTKLLSKLQQSLEISAPKSNHQNQHPMKQLSAKGRVPLRTFLFGTKPKKPSIFSCMSPAVRKHYNNLKHGTPS